MEVSPPAFLPFPIAGLERPAGSALTSKLKKPFANSGLPPNDDFRVPKLLLTPSLQSTAPPGPEHPNSDSGMRALPVSPRCQLAIDMLENFSVALLYLPI